MGDKVWVECHFLSKAAIGFASKLAPRRDGPYVIVRKRGPTSYEVVDPRNPTEPLGAYHAFNLTPYMGEPDDIPAPINKIRRRGRLRKSALPQGQFSQVPSIVDQSSNVTGSSFRRLRIQRGRLKPLDVLLAIPVMS